MEIGLRDIIGMGQATITAAREVWAAGLPAPSDVRARQQRIAEIIGKVGLYPVPAGLRQQYGVPPTSPLLPKLLSALRFVQKRPELGDRASATVPALDALVRMEPALASWEQGLQRAEVAGRHGVILVLRRMSESTDALTGKIAERLAAMGPGRDALRIRLSRVLQLQGQFSSVVEARRDRLRRQKEAGAQALAAARAETKLLRGAERLTQAGVVDAAALRLPARPSGDTEPVTPRAPAPRPRAGGPAAGGLLGGANVSAAELTSLALEAGAQAEGLGLPSLTEEESDELVLSTDPLVVAVANLYSLLLPAAPGPGVPKELEGLYAGELVQQTALWGELVDFHAEAERGLRGARDGHLLVASVAQQTVARLLKEVHLIVDQPPAAATEPLRGDAGDLLRLEEEERQDRLTAADRTRKDKAETAQAVRAVDRQNRFLRTVLSMRNRDGVSPQDLEEAIDVYQEIGDEQTEARKTRR